MNKETHTRLLGSSAALAFGLPGFGPRINFAPEGGEGGAAGGAGEGEAAAAAAAAAKVVADAATAKATADAAAAAAASGDTKPSDAEAKLLKDLMKAKDKLKAFEGVDAEEFKTLKAAKTAADAAAIENDRKAAEARGDFDRVKASMNEQHAKEKKDLQDKIDALTGDKTKLVGQIDELTIGSSFLNSKFVADDLVLTPSKARVVYGGYFAQEDGKTVAYDKPAGTAERTKLVDASGNALAFEDALKRIVDTDPDKDRMVRTKMRDGAGSGTTTTKTTTVVKDGELRGTSRILAGLAGLQKAK